MTITTTITNETSTKIKSVDKPKRKQVKNACVHCQKACKKCDDGRPCKRCIKLGLTATCRDSDRKERKKGVKRGPYKKRQKDGNSPNTKPVFPKLVHKEKQLLAQPIVYEIPEPNVIVSSHNNFIQDTYPIQASSLLSSPINSIQSDETLHLTCGYGTTTSLSSPSDSSLFLLDHQAISGNYFINSSLPPEDNYYYYQSQKELLLQQQFKSTANYYYPNQALDYQYPTQNNDICYYDEYQQPNYQYNMNQPAQNFYTNFNQPTINLNYWGQQ